MQSIFIDSLNAISSQLESNAIHILTHRKKNSQKIQSLVLQLTQFKCGVLSLLQSAVKQVSDFTNSSKQKVKRMLVELNQQRVRSSDKLSRYRLHQILKRKIESHKRSFMVQSAIGKEDNSLFELEKSVVLIQKDLGIEPEEESIMSRLGMSSIVHQTSGIAAYTPTKTQILRDYSIISEVGSLPLSNSQISQQSVVFQEKVKKENVFLANNQKNEKQETIKPDVTIKTVKNTLTSKKSKKTVYSKCQTGKQGLLGNLLEQTYNLCKDKQ